MARLYQTPQENPGVQKAMILETSASEADGMPDIVLAPASFAPPTIVEAFQMLCQALYPLLEDDLPAQMHCDDIQGWMANGNVAVAWSHAILLLEQVLGMEVLKR